LCAVIIRADAQSDHAIGRVIFRGQEQDWHVGIAAKLQAETDAVHRRHEDVERHEVGVKVVEGVHRLACIGDGLDLVPGLFQDGADQPSNVSIVVDNEDSPAQAIAARGWCGFLIQHL
jgi:hypothetical protein